MDMYNKIKSNDVDNVDFVDVELLRIERLIEERETYEQQFFSLESPAPDEFHHIVLQYENEIEPQEPEYEYSKMEYFEEDDFYQFEFEDYLLELRDERLIEERKEYEASFFSCIDEISSLEKIYAHQIASREQVEFLEEDCYGYDEEDYGSYEYDQYEEEMFWELHYLRQNQFRTPKPCECIDLDYMPYDDNICDYLDCYDYPEGPEENLCGVKYY